MRPLHILHGAALAALACAASVAWADPGLSARRSATPFGQSGHAARAGVSGDTALGTLSARRGFAADGQGNAGAATGTGFTTAAGGQGARLGKVNRSSDGSVNASGQSGFETAGGGSVDRSGSYTRQADGTASGERSTTATNANTGMTFDGSTTYAKGSGVSRSGSCKDASGTTVSCGKR
jgi:hypothetical protein